MDACHYGLKDFAALWKNEENAKEAIAFLSGDGFCGQLPEDVQKSCQNYINDYLPFIFPLLSDYVNESAHDICKLVYGQ